MRMILSQLVRTLLLWAFIIVMALVLGGWCNGPQDREDTRSLGELSIVRAAILDVDEGETARDVSDVSGEDWLRWADEHPAGEPPEGYALYVWNLGQPAITMPTEMAEGAYRVIQCESRHDERALNKSSQAAGLFQIHPIHRNRAERMGYTWEQMLEAQPNTDVAASIWEEQGWRPWQCKP